jgi:hypothetical protein
VLSRVGASPFDSSVILQGKSWDECSWQNCFLSVRIGRAAPGHAAVERRNRRPKGAGVAMRRVGLVVDVPPQTRAQTPCYCSRRPVQSQIEICNTLVKPTRDVVSQVVCVSVASCRRTRTLPPTPLIQASLIAF